MVARAAVAIGVNKTGGLTPLRAAVSGAKQVAEWLTGEGLQVSCLVDDAGPVTIDAVKRAIKTYVDLGTLEQLVIYFAGHGYLNGTAETWLLSGAPDDPDEAIGQTVSAELARSCGIRSVVFISDACRSNPPSLIAARVSGLSIFPNRQGNHVEVEVDRFFAAKPGDPALELPIEVAGTSYVGLFTEMLRSIHREPDQSLTRTIRLDGADAIVVPSRRLKEVLPERVNEAAQARSIQLKQKPQLRLECGEDTFIARAQFTGDNAPAHPTSEGEIKVAGRPEDSVFRGVRRRSRTSTRYSKFAYSSELASAMGPAFDQAVDRVRAADATGHFETQAGVQVTGADVAWAYGIGVLAEHIPTQQPALIRLRENVSDEVCRMPGSVIVQFGDGAGTVLAGLPGYVASVTVESGRVINISYVPSTNSPLWLEYSADHEWVEALRAVAAAAARNGLLAVDREDARRFGDVVRQAKKWDPTLGLYAALAYADVGLKKQLQSVETYMRRDLRANLFDVALLAGSMSEYPHSRVLSAAGVPTVPFCPMLSQTWSFFRPRGVEPPATILEASRYRLPALWTTFDREGVTLLRHAAEQGALP